MRGEKRRGTEKGEGREEDATPMPFDGREDSPPLFLVYIIQVMCKRGRGANRHQF